MRDERNDAGKTGIVFPTITKIASDQFSFLYFCYNGHTMTQAEALDILKMGKNVFLTGAAGSGKTHTLRTFVEWLSENGIGYAVTASTGIAATHLGGTTIHAWSGLGVRDSVNEYELDELLQRQYLNKRYENTQVLIIDEVSMLHHFRFDLVDQVARAFKRVDAPFGGMQIILCGDFFQLPPVSRPNEPQGLFAYSSNIWPQMGLEICYLEEQHRQSDDAFLAVLNGIRSGEMADDLFEALQDRFNKDIELEVEPTRLSTHNENVDAINEAELGKIDGETRVYEMRTKGKKNLVEALQKSCLAPSRLTLKVGARVMFVKNSFEKGYVNGTLGIVEGYDDVDAPLVKLANGKVVAVMPDSWKIEEDGSVKAELIQLPLRLAWAITIHKSQGMSLDAAEIDLSRSFAPGMGYVALSRVRSLSGLKLLGFNQRALMIHPEVLEKDGEFRRASERARAMLRELGGAELARLSAEYISKYGKTKKSPAEELLENLPSHHQTKLLVLEKISLSEIAARRELKTETIVSHIEKLLEEKEEIDIAHLKPTHFSDTELEAIYKAFVESYKKHGDLRLAPVKAALASGGHSKISYDDLRLARLFFTPEL